MRPYVSCRPNAGSGTATVSRAGGASCYPFERALFATLFHGHGLIYTAIFPCSYRGRSALLRWHVTPEPLPKTCDTSTVQSIKKSVAAKTERIQGLRRVHSTSKSTLLCPAEVLIRYHTVSQSSPLREPEPQRQSKALQLLVTGTLPYRGFSCL